MSGCELCPLENTEICLTCISPLYVHEGVCVPECPENFVVNDDKSACRNATLADLGILYFPFLIAALIFTIVILFGKCKKKAILVKGKVEKISYQSSITCIIVFIAPLQALATVAQWVLAILYGTMVHAILAALVTIIILVINIAFMIQFSKKFRSQSLTKEAEDKIKRGKLDKAVAWKEPRWHENSDGRFEAWYKRHKWVYWITSTFTVFSFWKFNKILYSRFYNYGMFTAYWQKAKVYRNLVNWYNIVTMITVDFFLICIDITGLIYIEWGNQLYITMIETCVLSVVSIILCSYELYRLTDYLEYTTDKDKKW